MQNEEKSSAWDFWRFTIIIIAILLPIRLFVISPFVVYGSSMEPTFNTGDYIIVDEISYKIKSPARGDVIVFKPPFEKDKDYIKRIIGLPGETLNVTGDTVTIKNAQNPDGFTLNQPYLKFHGAINYSVTLKPNQYFVMGDNRTVSYDSRSWGPLDGSLIAGKALVRLFPLNVIGLLPGSYHY